MVDRVRSAAEWYKIAATKYNRGEFDGAATAFGRARQAGADAARCFFYAGAAYHRAGRCEEAVAEYTAALESRPDWFDARHQRGKALCYLQRFAEAIGDLNAAVDLDPAHAEARRDLGCLMFQLGDLAGALDHFRGAVRLDPGDAISRISRGMIEMKLGRYEQALLEFDEVLRQDPTSVPARRSRALMREKLKDNEGSLLDWQALPDDSDAWHGRGRCLARLGRWAEARLALEAAASDDMTRNSLAWLLSTALDASVRDGRRALDVLERNEKIDGRTLDTRAAAYAEVGDFVAAVRCSDEALALAQDDEDREMFAEHRAKFVAGEPWHDAA